MGDMTRNFSKHEFACKCGCGFDDIDPKLVETLQEIREFWGKPIHITSGCRCAKHNKNVGGKATSPHLKGAAADTAFSDPDEKQKFVELVLRMHQQGRLPHLGGLGDMAYSNGCVHLDTKKAKDGHLRRW